jgi:hypothetical protein
MQVSKKQWPEFNLTRLLRAVFEPKKGERIGILIDLPEVQEAKDFHFLNQPSLEIQRYAHKEFYLPLKNGALSELKLRGGELFAYQVTGGSNLDLPDRAVGTDGRELSFEQEIYPNYDILLCISTFSATAPLTAAAKRFKFRGATLHGLNEVILRTGLAVDYNEVSRQAEKLRQGLTRADAFEIDFEVGGHRHSLKISCGQQEAQKSHGLARGEKPDVVNLPAGEVYYVPTSAEGRFPLRYEDGTLGLLEVADGRVRQATLLRGQSSVIEAHNRKLQSDPATGELGELGFGTQELPPSGRDIQDEKILGTLHVATGRSDHLGGKLTPDKFVDPRNATHEDILFSPTKTPEVNVPQVRMYRAGQTVVVIENYQPSAYLRKLLE